MTVGRLIRSDFNARRIKEQAQQEFSSCVKLCGLQLTQAAAPGPGMVPAQQVMLTAALLGHLGGICTLQGLLDLWKEKQDVLRSVIDGLPELPPAVGQMLMLIAGIEPRLLETLALELTEGRGCLHFAQEALQDTVPEDAELTGAELEQNFVANWTRLGVLSCQIVDLVQDNAVYVYRHKNGIANRRLPFEQLRRKALLNPQLGMAYLQLYFNHDPQGLHAAGLMFDEDTPVFKSAEEGCMDVAGPYVKDFALGELFTSGRVRRRWGKAEKRVPKS